MGQLDGNFLISHSGGLTAAMFSKDSGKMDPRLAPLNALWGQAASGVSNVNFGDGLLEFSSNWRLGDVDNTWITLSHKNGLVAMAWHKSGTEVSGMLQANLSTWTKTLEAKDVAFGDRFIQLGKSWRVGDALHLLTITYAPRTTVTVISDQGMKSGQGLTETIQDQVGNRPVEAKVESSVLHRISSCVQCGGDWCSRPFSAESEHVEKDFSIGSPLSKLGCSHITSRTRSVKNSASNVMYSVESRSGATLICQLARV